MLMLAALLALGCESKAEDEVRAKAEPAATGVKAAETAPAPKSAPSAAADAPPEASSEADQRPKENKAPQGAAPPAPPDVAAPPADAKKTPSGLVTKVLKKGTGKAHPKKADQVTVHYTGWTKDGKMFDSSVERNEPATFPLDQVIKGWTEALQLMVEGEQRRLWIPADLAYGERATRPGAPTGQLTFDVELIAIKEAPKPPAVPDDLKKPPASAKKTASGLAYRVLTKGTGKSHPKDTDRVKVHYSGWTLDGKMFDSSVTRGEPAVFPLNRVIKGWTEGVQLMVQGDKYRFWIPGELAYGDKPSRPGAPAGTLVFDIELLEVP
jgi:FKBP-type peptidyl-prolyl cis-trans isomerase